MFPSNISNSLQNPFEYSTEENPNTYFFNFPSELLDDGELLLGHLLHHHQHQATRGDGTLTALPDVPEASIVNPKNVTSTADNKDNAGEAVLAVQQKSPEAAKKKQGRGTRQLDTPRKRTGKKDRHSKIYTAQGPRDRRMRLSLQIARKFFDLQDMLGFDKASKTIDWLFLKSKAAIKELTGSLPQKKNLSSGSVLSEECTAMEIEENRSDPPSDRKALADFRRKNTNLHPPPPSLAREARDKARARARQRTREKLLQKESEKRKKFAETNPNSTISTNTGMLGSSSSSTLETGEESAGCCSQEKNSPIEISALAGEAAVEVNKSSSSHRSIDHQMTSVGIIESLLGTSRSSSLYDYQYPEGVPISGEVRINGQGFPCFWENLGMENARNINPGCGAAVTNTISRLDHQDQNLPDSNLSTMTTTFGIYLQPRHQENQLSCNNSR
ncbi:hypothetical protein Nepgr_033060 [Nepenthes gracilis]|uniref:Uncharacterized protein n=1 Tax=Nepenthes gracilis TaxID=150966 RepID=A0AAD3TM12_NEPGR|nr:hypothetical protein Nepgr_033060 [Nepenthes gracilis]